MGKKRDYKLKVSWEHAEKLLNFAETKGCHIDIFEGNLLDNYIIYGAKCIKINNAKPRRYIILQEVYLTGWSSEIELILTDDESSVSAFAAKFDEADED